MRIRSLAVVFLAFAALPACTPRPEAQAAEQVRAAISLLRTGQPEPAAHAFELATRLVPGHYEAWMRLARVRLDQRQFAQARHAASRLVALRGAAAYAHELLGRSALGASDEAVAVRELERALELDPGRRYLHVTLGRIHEHAGRYAVALASYTTAIESLPGVAEPCIGKARVLLGHAPGPRQQAGSRPDAAIREQANQLLVAARAAKAVSDAQRAEIVRLSAYIERSRRSEELLAARDGARQAVRSSGLLALLGARGSRGTVDSVWGDSALGSDASGVLGALMGDQIGDSFGYGGLGLRGTGSGGGTGEGTIGLGNIGTIGRTGSGSGVGYGAGMGRLGTRPTTPAATVSVAMPSVRGSLPSEVVSRIVQRRSNSFRYCYERELAREPSLAGRVSVRLAIAPSGTTTSATVTSSTLGNAAVDACVIASARRLVFPSSQGVVIVDFPLTFAH